MYTKPFLTIAIPTYNGAKTIRNVLDLLLPQVTEEVEIIISDNCSTDETPAIIKEYASFYPFIQVLQSETNIFADGNFLKCIKSAKGEYMMLLSDDDIIVENALQKIICFLKKNNDIQLAYLETILFHDKYIGKDKCERLKPYVNDDIVSCDKKKFFYYAGPLWGFTSCFIWNTSRCQSIHNPEQYLNTYWLQAYIAVLCSNKKDDVLGIISGPCIAIGGYGVINNYDVALVEGIYYKKMLDFAAENGYDKGQIEKCWVHGLCRHSAIQIIKEKSVGKHLTSKRKLFQLLYKYPYAWIHLFPVYLLPPLLCRAGIMIRHRLQGRKEVAVYINRPT